MPREALGNFLHLSPFEAKDPCPSPVNIVGRMNLRRAFLFIAITSFALASEPKEVAEAAMRAWVSHDAKSLYQLSHPELISRMRSARAVLFYLKSHPEKGAIPRSGSDSEVVSLMCEALAAIVPPRDDRFVYEDRYVDTKEVGHLAIVTFESSATSVDRSSKARSSPTRFVLKQKDGKWLFMWSPAVSLHVDLAWDPRS